MKQTIYMQLLSLLMLLATACSQEELPASGNSGYLSLNVAVGDVKVNVVRTKAFELPEVEIKIDILQNGAVYDNHSYSLGTLPAKIKLEKGSYTLKIYPADGNSGPEYDEYTKDFTIEEGKTTNLGTVEMKMQNLGVALVLPDGFDDWFKSYTFTVTMGETTRTLQNGGIAYFDKPETNNFTYKLEAVNLDGETMSMSENYLKDNTGRPVLDTNTIYDMETKSLVVR